MALAMLLAEYSAMTADQVRVTLKRAIKERGANPTVLSRSMNRSQGYLSEFLRGKKETLGAAESSVLEGILELPPGALVVTFRQGPPAARPARVEGYRPPPTILGDLDLPVFAATEGGKGEMVVSSDPIEIVPRPWYMKNVKDGYAVLVTGESMEPRYSPGEIVVVNPKAALVRGKDCIIHTAREGGDFRAMVKAYRGQTGDKWRLTQFNPPPGEERDFDAPRREWPFAYRVVGRYDGG